MFCTNCGYELDDKAKFCPMCGTSVAAYRNLSGSDTPPDLPDSGTETSYEYDNYDDERTVVVRKPPVSNDNQTYQTYNTGYNYNADNSYDNAAGTSNSNAYTSSEDYSANKSNSNSYNNSNNYNNSGSYGNTYNNSSTYSNNTYGNTDDWQTTMTPNNLERFAPLATFLPLVTILLRIILTIVLNIILPFGYRLRGSLINVLTILIMLVAIAATAVLVYVVVTRKNTASIHSWITPIGTFLAVIACFAIWRRIMVLEILFTLISFLFGLEFLARILIAGEDIASPFNPGAAFSTYAWYIQNYREQYPTSKELERSGYVDPENSCFDGSGFELLGYNILTVIVSTITCGLAYPWMHCKITKWRLEHTVINGERLTFTGSGGSLFGHWILWEILTIVTCGIYGLFLHCAFCRWELEHTFIQGEPVCANDKVSYFDGASLPYVGYSIIAGLLTFLTCGLAFPWTMTMLQRWDTQHEVINGRRLKYSGTGIGFLGEFLIIFILTFITCGIYSAWGTVRMNKYIIRNTDFVEYV